MKKKLLVLGMCVLMTFGLTGCFDIPENSVYQEENSQEELMREVNDEVGMPDITNFYEKKLAKRVLELRDDSKLITYAYSQNKDGKYVYLGKCVGYGIPYSVQYTNPDKTYNSEYALPQADPNGLYSPEGGVNATWLVLVDEETGKESIVYAEENITVSQTKLPKRLVADWSLPKNY